VCEPWRHQPRGLARASLLLLCSGRHRRGMGTTVDTLCIGPMRTCILIKVRSSSTVTGWWLGTDRLHDHSSARGTWPRV